VTHVFRLQSEPVG